MNTQPNQQLTQSKRQTTRKQVILPLSTILKQLNQHFFKIFSFETDPHSPNYPHLVMAHVEKVKVTLESLTIGIIEIEHTQTLQSIIEFWEHLIYICQFGLINATMEIIFRLLNECITMKTFHQMAILLLKKETENQQLLTLYRKYKILCRETYSSMLHLFNTFFKTIVGDEIIEQLSTSINEKLIWTYSKRINSIVSIKEFQVLIINLLAPVCAIDRDALHFIDMITENTFDPSKTICHYNPHFLLEFIGGKKVEKKVELESCLPLLLLFHNRFLFMIHFIPKWMEQLKLIKMKEELIVKTNEYMHYKQWLYSQLGKNLRLVITSKETTFLCDCVKGFLNGNDIKELNELIHIIKTNTNIYDTRQMTRMARLIEAIMNQFISLQNGNVMVFDHDFNIDDFIQIFELSISAEHGESMLKLLGIVYTTLPYFIGEARNTLLLKYFFEKRFVYFFFHWSDLVRNAFYHIILFRSLFVKEKDLTDNKLTSDDLKQYSKRSSKGFDPKNQDLIMYTALLSRLEMTQTLIDSIPEEGYSLDEIHMMIRYKEYEKVRLKYNKWLINKDRLVSDIPKIQTSYFLDKVG